MFVSQDKHFFSPIYIDSLLLFSSNERPLTNIKNQLNVQLRMTNLVEVSHHLDMEIDVEVRKQISLRQTVYLKKIPRRFQMTNCQPVSLPMNPVVSYLFLLFNRQAARATIEWYQSAIVSFMLLALLPRLNMSHFVRVFAWYCANLGPIYSNLVIELFRYFAKIIDLGITFRSDITNQLVRYTDSI